MRNSLESLVQKTQKTIRSSLAVICTGNGSRIKIFTVSQNPVVGEMAMLRQLPGLCVRERPENSTATHAELGTRRMPEGTLQTPANPHGVLSSHDSSIT